MDDLNLFGKSDNQTDSLVQRVFTFSEDMEFGLKKSEVVIPKKRKLLSLMEFIYLTRK